MGLWEDHDTYVVSLGGKELIAKIWHILYTILAIDVPTGSVYAHGIVYTSTLPLFHRMQTKMVATIPNRTRRARLPTTAAIRGNLTS